LRNTALEGLIDILAFLLTKLYPENPKLFKYSLFSAGNYPTNLHFLAINLGQETL